MHVDATRMVGSLIRELDGPPTTEQAVEMAVLRKLMDATETSAVAMLAELQPHLGKHVDTRA